jgi:molybdenum cofactor biosynthesis enzyme MoaA
MTPNGGVLNKEPEINWRNFRTAVKLAKMYGADTAMITGKGEPTLFPGQISKYMKKLNRQFPLIELQTNGISIAQDYKKFDPLIKEWYDNGLTTVAISIVHYEPEKNRQIYLPNQKSYINLPELTDYLHDKGLSVRLACIMNKGYIDDAESLENLIQYSKSHSIEQLTVRAVNKPEESRNKEVYDWTIEHLLTQEQKYNINNYLETKGHKLLELPHGATIYDVNGQNVCYTNSLTRDVNPDKIRQLIFFPDGHLRYDWEYMGAILL